MNKRYRIGKRAWVVLPLIAVLAGISIIYGLNKNSLPDPHYSPDYFAQLLKKGMPGDAELCVSGLLGLEAYVKRKPDEFHVEPVAGAIGGLILRERLNVKLLNQVSPAFRPEYLEYCKAVGMPDHEVTIFKGIMSGETPKSPQASLTKCLSVYLLVGDGLEGRSEDAQADIMLHGGESYGAAFQFVTELFKGAEGKTLEGTTRDALPLYALISKAGGLSSKQGKQAVQHCAYFGLNPTKY